MSAKTRREKKKRDRDNQVKKKLQKNKVECRKRNKVEDISQRIRDMVAPRTGPIVNET